TERESADGRAAGAREQSSAVVDGDAAAGQRPGDAEGTGVDGGRTGVGLPAVEQRGSRATLAERSGSADDAGKGGGAGGVVEGDGAVVDDVSFKTAGIPGEGAGVDDGESADATPIV